MGVVGLKSILDLAIHVRDALSKMISMSSGFQFLCQKTHILVIYNTGNNAKYIAKKYDFSCFI